MTPVNPSNPATQTNPPVHFDDPVSEKLGRRETMRPAADATTYGLNGRSLAQILNSNIPCPNPQNTVQNDCALCHTSATPELSYPALLNSPEYSIWNAGQMGGCTGCHLANRLGHVPTNEEYREFKEDSARQAWMGFMMPVRVAPITGDVLDFIEYTSGRDIVTGAWLTETEKADMAVFASMPYLTGGMTRVGRYADEVSDLGRMVDDINDTKRIATQEVLEAEVGIVVRPRGTLGTDDAGHFWVSPTFVR